MSEIALGRVGRGWKLTTDHSASSYGIPVLVDRHGEAYGPADIIIRGGRTVAAADFVREEAARCGLGENELVIAFRR